MFLHLTPDAPFIDTIINKIKKTGLIENHKFIIFNKSSINDIESIKNIEFITPYFFSKKTNYQDIDKKNIYDKIVIHCLVDQAIDFVLKVPDSKKVYWVFWGGDFYKPLPPFLRQLIEKNTRRWYLKEINKDKFNLPIAFIELKIYLKTILSDYLKNKIRAIKRVDYFLHWNDLDYSLVIKHYNLKAKFVPFYYGNAASFQEHFVPNEFVLSQIRKDLFIKGNEKVILLGNSGTIANNHLDIIPKLAKTLKNKSFKIICPLSYGSEAYIKEVIKCGKKHFQSKFIPLTEMIEKDKYFSLLHIVNIAIFNHKRPQGGDHIYYLVSIGKKIFLNGNNTLYKLYKKQNINVYNIISEFNVENLLTDLPDSLQKQNYKYIKTLFDGPLKNTAKLFEY